jgi:hypothetical protein
MLRNPIRINPLNHQFHRAPAHRWKTQRSATSASATGGGSIDHGGCVPLPQITGHSSSSHIKQQPAKLDNKFDGSERCGLFRWVRVPPG